MPQRGSYQFATDDSGCLLDGALNFEKTRQMLLDWKLILYQGGPGTAEANNGSWHVLCHLAGAAGIFAKPDGKTGWAGITYDPERHSYRATFSFRPSGEVATLPLDSPETHTAIKDFALRGYVEGASRGHILDRSANDPGDPATTDRRQDYDEDPSSSDDGGPVWEHWCTSRDINNPSSLGTGMLKAYLTLVSFLGGRFAGTVARGRIEAEYGHVIQLRGLVRSGFISMADAGWDIRPTPIPAEVERTLYEARPDAFLEGATKLLRVAPAAPQYFMFERKIRSFAPVEFALKVIQAE